MEERTRELIAIGASVTANCEPCLRHHLRKAAECGAGREEISAALAVGKEVRKGAAAMMERLIARLEPEGFSASAGDAAPQKGCGCGS